MKKQWRQFKRQAKNLDEFIESEKQKISSLLKENNSRKKIKEIIMEDTKNYSHVVHNDGNRFMRGFVGHKVRMDFKKDMRKILFEHLKKIVKTKNLIPMNK